MEFSFTAVPPVDAVLCLVRMATSRNIKRDFEIDLDDEATEVIRAMGESPLHEHVVLFLERSSAMTFWHSIGIAFVSKFRLSC
jgi:hypothetical protein